MDTRSELQERELEFLRKLYAEKPSLFEQQTFIENEEFLSNFGIFLKNKNLMPHGYIKLWPQDFLVEEILSGGGIQTVNFGNAENSIAHQEPVITLYATLVKCGVSTLEAIDEMATMLKLDKKYIQFAGIKDKDAITAQQLSLRNITVSELRNASSPYFFLKDLLCGKGALQKGILAGNKFTILVRLPEGFNAIKLQESIADIKTNGFYNFYYIQRFGTPRLINFLWGYNILQGNYRETVENYLTGVGERELLFFKNIRDEAKNHIPDWQKVKKLMEPFPLLLQTELRLVNHLIKYSDDYRGALQEIPEQVTLWVYAFASWLFNNILSSFIKEGDKPPLKLPLLWNKDQLYKNILAHMDLLPLPLHNLKPFPTIQTRAQYIDTKVLVRDFESKIVDAGIIVSFSLPKGAYATTLLAHLFCLVSGVPEATINETPMDLKDAFGFPSISKTLDYFKPIAFPKTKNIFDIDL